MVMTDLRKNDIKLKREDNIDQFIQHFNEKTLLS